MVCGDFKDLPRITAADKALRDKAFNIAKNPRYDGCQRGLAFKIQEFDVIQVLFKPSLIFQFFNFLFPNKVIFNFFSY